MNWLHRKQTAYLYPYACRQRLTVYEPFVSVCRNFIATKGHAVWTLALDASFRQGTGEPSSQLTVPGSLSAEANASAQPTINYSYLYREYQWLTAAQYHIGGSVKYAFSLRSSALSRIRPYVKASLSHRKANGGSHAWNSLNDDNAQNFTLQEKGNDRTTAAIAFGCNF